MTFVTKLAAGLVAVGAAAMPGAASAQVTYDTAALPFVPGLSYPYTDESPYAVAYGERPSFVVVPSPYGAAPRVGVVERCNYPNGWNVTDFSRDVNGIPAGIDHQCPEPPRYRRVRARY